MFIQGGFIKSNIKLILLNKEKASAPFVLRMNGFVSLFIITFGIFVFVLTGIGIYYSSLFFANRSAYSKETIKNKRLLSKLDSLHNIVEKETHLFENISILETELSLSQGISPVSNDIKNLNIGGYQSFKEKINILLGSPLEMLVSNIEETISNNKRQTVFFKNRLERLEGEVQRQNNYFSEKPSIYPVNGRITSKFGYRPHPFLIGTLFHEGIDIANQMWMPVKAPADGICTFSGLRGGYGTLVEITHKRTGYVTRYGHLADAKVKIGEQLKRGEIIGFVGSSGRSTGPHLHYEIIKDGKPVNPLNYITCEQSTSLIID